MSSAETTGTMYYHFGLEPTHPHPPKKVIANTLDADQMLQNAASDRSPHLELNTGNFNKT